MALLVALVAIGVLLMRRERRAAATGPALDRSTWRMPPLAELTAPAGTMARNIGLLVLRGYLIVAAILVAVRFGQVLLGH